MTSTEIAEPSAATAAAEPPKKRALPLLPLLVAGCFALAALSLLLPTTPTVDSWSWIVWGREVVHFSLDTTSGSSWKPLPVVFTSVFSFFGNFAPELWILVARAGGLLALVFAYRIAWRLGGHLAGVIAAAGLASADWLRYLAHGNVEPLSAGLVLGAVDRHQEGHTHQAAALGALAALGRAELWPFLFLYCGYVIWKKQARLVAVIVCLLVVPVGWLGGDWAGSGDPFHGSNLAKGFAERAEQRAAVKRAKGVSVAEPPGFVNTLEGGADILILPVEIAALAGLGFAVYRRNRAALIMAGGAGGLILVVGTMTELGYGGSPRFLFPAAGLACVLAGYGVSELLRTIGSRFSNPRVRYAVVGGVAVALLAVSMPDTIHRAQRFELRAEKSALRARLQSEMEITVDRAKAKAGGRDKLLAKGHLLGNPSFTHQLAWEMNVPMGDVGGRKLPYVAFSVPKTNASSTAGPRLPTRGVRKERLARYGDWRAVAVSEKKPSP